VEGAGLTGPAGRRLFLRPLRGIFFPLSINDDLVKSQQNNGFVKSSKYKARKN
jgi:hypothetical protein